MKQGNHKGLPLHKYTHYGMLAVPKKMKNIHDWFYQALSPWTPQPPESLGQLTIIFAYLPGLSYLLRKFFIGKDV